MAVTKADIYRHVRYTLGDGLVNVELKDEHIDSCIQAALDLFNAYTPRQGGMRLAPTSAPQDLTLVVPDIGEVTAVSDLRERSILPEASVFPATNYTWSPLGETGVAPYYSALETLEMQRIVTGAAIQYQTNRMKVSGEEHLFIVLHAAALSSIRYIGCTYTRHLQATDAGITSIPLDMMQWFRAYVVASATRLLGRIRAKYQGVPGPEGNDFSTDGTDLITSAENDLATLEDRITGMRPTLSPIIF